jgi:hypothetical protein
MNETTALHQVLQPHIDWHKARLAFCASFIVALVKVRTVNLTQVALALNPAAKPSSNYRRIQRFLADFELDFEVVARLMLALVPVRSDFVVTIDRTNWQFGRTPINIFMIGIAWRGLAFPIMWRLLPKSGISSTGERIALMERFLEVVSPDRIRVVVADREFVGRDWIAFLREQNLRFVIRIRKNARVGSECRARPAREHFASLRAGCVQVLRKKRWVYGHRLFVVGLRLEPQPQGELLLVVTGEQPRRALGLYAKRWQIETLFGALKSRGFNFEETHLTDPGRIEKLVALLTVAFTWAYLVGDWLDRDVQPIRVKSHGRRAKSLFRYGLDHLRSVLLNMTAKIDEFFACLQVLSCT